MQNKFRSCDEAGYVVLSGGWSCPRCGCANNGCDTCCSCGWNRCGCQGGVVFAAQTTRNDCVCADKARQSSRDNDCDDCPASFVTGHSVQCCPDNTRIRRDCDCDCGCEETAYQNRSGKCGCGCEETAYQNRSGKCGCEETAYQNRSGKCGCEETVYQNRSGKCGCEQQSRGRNARVGIVHGVEQELADVFESESALRTGTLFPELHKPMNGRCPGCSNCSTCQQQAAFAAWDLRLYLNTHPDDKAAWALFRRLNKEADEPNYATTFLDTDGCDSGWTWTEGPWPWECQECGE